MSQGRSSVGTSLAPEDLAVALHHVWARLQSDWQACFGAAMAVMMVVVVLLLLLLLFSGEFPKRPHKSLGQLSGVCKSTLSGLSACSNGKEGVSAAVT